MNHLTCFTVAFPADNDVCDMEPRAFVLQLKRRVDDQLLTVNFHSQNVTVNINDGKVYTALCFTSLYPPLHFLAQDCASAINSAAIVVPIILILILIAIIIIAVALLLYFKKGRSHRYFPEHLGKHKSVS